MYTIFFINKKSGGIREIQAPTNKLKQYLPYAAKVLLGFFKGYLQLHKIESDYSTKGNKANAMVHKGAKVLLSCDIENYYGSITKENFFKAFNFNHNNAELISKYCFYKNALPTGSPTSNIIAKYFLAEEDFHMFEVCYKLKCDYSRYVDDICISGESKENVMQCYSQLKILLLDKGLSLKESKFRVQCSGRHQSVTGITITTIGVGRKYIKRTDLMLKKTSKDDKRTLNIIRGRISYTKNTNPDVAKRQKKILMALLKG